MQTIIQFFQSKKNKEKISVITCYDASFSKLVSKTMIDCILVGDSLGMVIQGFNSTIPVTLDEMIYHTKNVKRGNTNKYIISDLPFLSYQTSIDDAIFSAGRVLKETEADAIKLEGAGKNIIETIERLTEIGVPVMGHLGLTPQSFQTLGGYRVQGKDSREAEKIYEDALALEKAGVFSLVLEMIPASLGKKISESLKIPTIGIGAGVHTDGQVLVIYDLLGMNQDFEPKFLKKYANLEDIIVNSLNQYHEETTNSTFPKPENSF